MRAEASFLDEEEIRGKIVNKNLQKLKIFIYDSTDSTNTRAKLFAESEDFSDGAVFIAAYQSAGRGRMGRRFDSEKGCGLYISFLTSGARSCSDVGETVRAAVNVSLAIERLFGYSPRIKWVNDITADGRKLAGILAEGSFGEMGELLYSVIGIGINLYSRPFPEEIADIATTLEDVTGKRLSPADLAAALIDLHFGESNAPEILRAYRERSSVLGRRIRVRRLGGEEFYAFASEITDKGALAVIHDSGEREELISAEVSVRLD